MFMSLLGNNMFALFHIIEQCLRHFITKVDKIFLSAFSYDPDTVILKIDILDIQSHAFRNTNTGSQQKSKECQIPHFILFKINLFHPGHFFAAMFDIVQQIRNFIVFQTNNFFFMKFWHIHDQSRIIRNQFPFIVIDIKTS